MSVQVLQVRFPGLLVAISVERYRRRREGRFSLGHPVKAAQDRPIQRFPSVAGVEPSLMKFQM